MTNQIPVNVTALIVLFILAAFIIAVAKKTMELRKMCDVIPYIVDEYGQEKAKQMVAMILWLKKEEKEELLDKIRRAISYNNLCDEIQKFDEMKAKNENHDFRENQ